MSREIFVNLSVRDLDKSKEFFAALGFTFNPQFTDENAACMIISDKAYVMLLVEPYFRGFMDNQICDTSTHTEALFALSCASKAEVDHIVRKAIEAGGRHAKNANDLGFMYSWSFYDLDGHHWEVLFMDPAAVQ
ncbi:MAG TPA: VOC family protein [Thermoanaerobaculia bacterium]|jgi:predicted lactoylglutathione lyase|nr:VOC family protein [Thermoanaerobaculia bacterium]